MIKGRLTAADFGIPIFIGVCVCVCTPSASENPLVSYCLHLFWPDISQSASGFLLKSRESDLKKSHTHIDRLLET